VRRYCVARKCRTLKRSALLCPFQSAPNRRIGAFGLAVGAACGFSLGIAVYDRAFSLLPYRTVKERVARFCQIQKDRRNTHHDALEFPSGRLVLVTRLREGQRLMVLQLPALPLEGIKPDEHRHPSFVD
jgi:hypothetical protein